MDGRHYGSKGTFEGAKNAEYKNYAEPQSFRMPKADKHCEKCIYYTGRICDYIGVTHQARILVSPPPKGAKPGELGKYCTARVERAKKRKQQAMSVIGRKRKPKAAETPSVSASADSSLGDGAESNPSDG